MPDCARQCVLFPDIFSKPIVIESTDQPMSSDGGAILLIPIDRTMKLTESLAALNVALTAVEVERIEAALPPTAVAGTRYDEHQMRVLDSEREGASK